MCIRDSGSALGALNGVPQWEEKVMELMDAVDTWIPLPPRDIDKPYEIIFPWSIRVFVADQYYWNISPLTQNTFP